MNRLSFVFITFAMIFLNACYKPPLESEITLKNPNTPDNWKRITYRDLTNDEIYNFNSYGSDYIYDRDNNLYVLGDGDELMIYKDSGDIQIVELNGSVGHSPRLLFNSENELYLKHSYRFDKIEGNQLVELNLLEQRENWDGSTYTGSVYEYESAVFDEDDLVWFINDNDDVYRQLPGSMECAQIPDSLFLLSGWYTSAKQLFYVNNEVWILNSNDEMFRYVKSEDRFEFIAEIDFRINDDVRLHEHEGVYYFEAYYTVYTYSNNHFKKLILNAYNTDGDPIDEFSLRSLDFDQDGNMLLSNGSYPIFYSNGEGHPLDPYYEDDFIYFLHTKNNEHLIIGSNALYIINNL